LFPGTELNRIKSFPVVLGAQGELEALVVVGGMVLVARAVLG
jgi:hypothetical protein